MRNSRNNMPAMRHNVIRMPPQNLTSNLSVTDNYECKLDFLGGQVGGLLATPGPLLKNNLDFDPV